MIESSRSNGDEPFEDRRHLADRAPRVLGEHGVVDHRLALPVVAQPARLQHRRVPTRPTAAAELLRRRHRFVRGGRQSDVVEQLLLPHPILGGFERLGRREHLGELHQEPSRFHGDVLELVRDDVGAVG